MASVSAEDHDGTVVSSLSSNTSPSWVPRQVRQQEETTTTAATTTATEVPQRNTRPTTTPALGMKAVYAQNEDAAEAGAVAAARDGTEAPPLVPLARRPSSGERSSDANSSTVNVPLTRLVTQESTPGAVSMPGIDGSTDDDRHDNLLDEESGTTHLGVSQPASPLERRPEQSPVISPSSVSYATRDDETPIVAELAPSYSFDHQDVEQRLAERLEAQMEERLRREVDLRLSQERRQHAIAQVVQKEAQVHHGGSGSFMAAASVQEEENFKICGIRRTCWGMILCTFLLFIAGGVVGAVLWFARENSRNTEASADASQPTAVPVSPPPTSVPSVLRSENPTASPTRPLIDQRWDFLLAQIGPVVVPPDEDPEEYFADTSTPQYAAMAWMATLDMTTDVFQELNTTLIERYVLTVLFYTTGGPVNWIDSNNFLSAENVCDWNNSTTNKGVFCSSMGPVVTRILMPDNGLQGPIPWELSLLEYVLEIELDGNGFYGTIPTELGSLARLESLWLKSNALTGALPAELANATSLSSLDFGDNILDSKLPPQWGSSLDRLFYLKLGPNEIEGTLPVEWKGLSSLSVLDLEGNNLDGNLPAEYGLLTKLSSLYLESNKFQGSLPAEYGGLVNLENFFVYNNLLSGTISTQLSSLTKLENFWFHANDLTGSVNDIFCLIPTVGNFRADCRSEEAGVPPQITCNCCTSCCTRNGTNCINVAA